MSTSPTRWLYACRDNATHSLLPCDGAPRVEKYCRACIPLRGGECCLLSSRQIARLQRTLGLTPRTLPRCTKCHRPNETPRFKNCPRCRAKARARMKRIKR